MGAFQGSFGKARTSPKHCKNHMIFMILGVPAPPKNERKWLQKRLAAATGRQERLGGLLGSILERFWAHVGVPNRSKNASKSKLEFDVILERFWGPFLEGPATGGWSPGGGDLGELPAVTLGVFIELVSIPFPRFAPRPLVEPHRLSGRISSGAAPPIPATEPRIVCCSCVKRFRKTFRPVFSNSFFVCLWASEGLEFGPPGGSFWASRRLLGALGRALGAEVYF